MTVTYTPELRAAAQKSFTAFEDALLHVPTAVTPRSRPIAWFGDAEAYGRSDLRIVTVGLNPSLTEFPADDPDLRFPAGSETKSATPGFLHSQNDYFRVEPYMAWFRTYRHLLRGLGASFTSDDPSLGRRVLHTDLCSPVPTSPTWSRLDRATRAALASVGVPIWHDTIRALRPDLALVSVAHAHLATIAFEARSEWETIRTVAKQKSVVDIRLRRYDVDGHTLHVAWARAGTTPFQLLTNQERYEVGRQLDGLVRVR